MTNETTEASEWATQEELCDVLGEWAAFEERLCDVLVEMDEALGTFALHKGPADRYVKWDPSLRSQRGEVPREAVAAFMRRIQNVVDAGYAARMTSPEEREVRRLHARVAHLEWRLRPAEAAR